MEYLPAYVIDRRPRGFPTKGDPMFPEYRDLITNLQHRDQHFTRLFDEHNDLDQKILNLENRSPAANAFEIEALKKEKLRLKDELHALLKKAAGH